MTWDGPLSTYLEALFLPIFAALRTRGYRFHVLQFTWSDDRERARVADACRGAGISYRSVTIWRRPVALGSLATAVAGRIHVRRAMREQRIGLLMPRSTLPALAAIPAAGRGPGRLPVLLDADGLPHDERVDFEGASPKKLSYRILRNLESWSVRLADAVTVRTQAAADILLERAGPPVGPERFHVVANARDAESFRPGDPQARAARRAQLGLAAEQPLLVYVGSSLGGKYRGEAVLGVLREVLALRGDARLLVLMPDDREARALLATQPDLAPACILRSAAPGEVPAWLAAADLGLALIHATFSMRAVSAIKIGEYLLCGVPVLASSGVGDADAIVGPTVGRCVAGDAQPDLAAAARWFVDEVLPDREGFRARCRAAGLRHFSLEAALDAYDAALRDALARGRAPVAV